MGEEVEQTTLEGCLNIKEHENYGIGCWDSIHLCGLLEN